MRFYRDPLRYSVTLRPSLWGRHNLPVGALRPSWCAAGVTRASACRAAPLPIRLLPPAGAIVPMGAIRSHPITFRNAEGAGRRQREPVYGGKRKQFPLAKNCRAHRRLRLQGAASRSDHIRSIRSGPRRPEDVRGLHGSDRASLGNDRAGRCIPPPLGAEPSRAGRLEGVRVFSGTAGTCRVRVRNPGALRGRLGAGVVAYVPRYGAYVTLSRAPRGTAVFPVHCCHSSLPGRYASAAYTPVCGGTTGNMPRIPAGGVLRYASVCVGMVHL